MLPNHIEHHGIKGMRWGIRRYQNPDGTLTEAGKRRYSRSDGNLNEKGQRHFSTFDKNGRPNGLTPRGLAYFRSQGYNLQNNNDPSYSLYAYSKVSSPSGRDTFVPNVSAIGQDIDAATANVRQRSGQMMEDTARAFEDVNSAVKTAATSKEAHDAAMAYMKRDLVSANMVDDRDLVRLSAEDAAHEVIPAYAKKTEAGKRVDAYIASMQQFYSDAKKETERLIADKKDVVIGRDRDGIEYTYKDVVNATIAKASDPYLAYVSRHGVWEIGMYSDDIPEVDSFVNQLIEDFSKT